MSQRNTESKTREAKEEEFPQIQEQFGLHSEFWVGLSHSMRLNLKNQNQNQRAALGP